LDGNKGKREYKEAKDERIEKRMIKRVREPKVGKY
jgi:hypothetical protein